MCYLLVADDVDTPNKTLAESAAAHQAKIARPELQEVEVKTGEEDESNVFQVRIYLMNRIIGLFKSSALKQPLGSSMKCQYTLWVHRST